MGQGQAQHSPPLGVGECAPLPVLGGIRYSWNAVPPCGLTGPLHPQPVTFWILGGVERPGGGDEPRYLLAPHTPPTVGVGWGACSGKGEERGLEHV